MSIGTLLAYTIVSLCIVILRYQPESIGLIKEPRSRDDSLATPVDGRENTLSASSPLLPWNGACQPTQKTAVLALCGIGVSTLASGGLSAVIIWGSHSLLQAEWWAILIVIPMGLLLIGSFILLLRLPQNKAPLPFKVPCVPLLPQLSIFINLFLILKLSYLTWIRFAVWMVIGKLTIQFVLENQIFYMDTLTHQIGKFNPLTPSE